MIVKIITILGISLMAIKILWVGLEILKAHLQGKNERKSMVVYMDGDAVHGFLCINPDGFSSYANNINHATLFQYKEACYIADLHNVRRESKTKATVMTKEQFNSKY